MQKNPSYFTWKDSAVELCRKTLSTLSSAVKDQLAKQLVAAEGQDASRFGTALNTLAADEATQENLLEILRKECPGLKPTDRLRLVRKAFRRRISALRTFGQKVVFDVLGEAVPELSRSLAEPMELDAGGSAEAATGKKARGRKRKKNAGGGGKRRDASPRKRAKVDEASAPCED
eukprot:TRINITY_DN23494_c0_g1_i4.p2 TRINITY_DN23494_c0_g1~~TRINITY_DN23494_c0_g1_i4.p2  ORF type:complete len:175 (+),score=63.11 TRINITY_DN23494_c0_g1_i4:249-773(+)